VNSRISRSETTTLQRGGASRAARSQAEPGNEITAVSRFLDVQEVWVILQQRKLNRRGAARALVGCLIAAITVLAGVAQAGKAKFNKVLNVGDKAPAWSDLPGVDGKTHSLKDFGDARAVVVVFTCNHCPVAKQYEERLAAFAKKYEKQVRVVAISVSHHGADRL